MVEWSTPIFKNLNGSLCKYYWRGTAIECEKAKAIALMNLEKVKVSLGAQRLENRKDRAHKHLFGQK